MSAGLSCRWASSHKKADQQTTAVASPTADTVTAASAHQPANGTISGQPATDSEHLPTTSGRIMSLPTEELIHNSTNLLGRDVQIRLRKGQYDFSAANQALRGLNILTSRKGAKQKLQKRAEANGDVPTEDLQFELDGSQQEASTPCEVKSHAAEQLSNGNAAHEQLDTVEPASSGDALQPSAAYIAQQSTAVAADPAVADSAMHDSAAAAAASASHDSAEPAGKRQRCDESAMLHDYAQSMSQQFRGPENGTGEQVKLFDSRMASGAKAPAKVSAF